MVCWVFSLFNAQNEWSKLPEVIMLFIILSVESLHAETTKYCHSEQQTLKKHHVFLQKKKKKIQYICFFQNKSNNNRSQSSSHTKAAGTDKTKGKIKKKTKKKRGCYCICLNPHSLWSATVWTTSLVNCFLNGAASGRNSGNTAAWLSEHFL